MSKIRFTTNERVVEVEDNSCVDIFNTMELMRSALLAIGFHPDSVKDGFLAIAEEYYDEEMSDETGQGGCGGNCSCSNKDNEPEEVQRRCNECDGLFWTVKSLDEKTCAVCREL